MLKYIIRLDDACPTMNEKKWQAIEMLLDKYNIKPIVGIIPDNKDSDFKYPKIKDFWKKYPHKWQEKGWIIAVHGYNHNLTKTIRTEFSSKSYKEQKKTLHAGYTLLRNQGLMPKCFFAPNHTFDDNTIKACKDLGIFEFISDGYAYYPYKYKGMIFLPSVFDTPHKVSSKGIFTFVYHPNNITEEKLIYLENFIKANLENFNVNIDYIITKYSNRKKTIKDYILQFEILIYRMIRNIIKKKG